MASNLMQSFLHFRWIAHTIRQPCIDIGTKLQ